MQVNAQDIIDTARTHPRHVVIALLCAAILLVDGYNIAVLGYLGPKIAEDWGLAAGELGSIFSASLAGNLVGYLVLSPLSYRYGPKRMAIASLALFGSAEILAAFSGAAYQLILFRFIAGAGLASGITNAVALAGEYAPARWRSTAVTYIYIGYTAGQMAAGEATRLLLGQGYGWQAPLMLGGAVALCLAVFLVPSLPDSPEYLINRAKLPDRAGRNLARIAPGAVPPGAELVAGSTRSSHGSVRQLFQDGRARATVLFWIAMTMNSVVVGSVSSWLTTLLVDSGLPHDEAVRSAVLVSAAGIAAGLVIGPLMDRLGTYRVMIALLVVGAWAGLALGSAMPLGALLWVSLAAFALTFCTSGLTKGASALAVYVYPTAIRGTGIGWMLGVSRVGGILGPLSVGALLEWGWTAGAIFKALGLPLGIGALAMLVAYRDHVRSR